VREYTRPFLLDAGCALQIGSVESWFVQATNKSPISTNGLHLLIASLRNFSRPSIKVRATKCKVAGTATQGTAASLRRRQVAPRRSRAANRSLAIYGWRARSTGWISASSMSCFLSQVSKKCRSRWGEIGCGSPAAIA
jgi:hypothetical protein